LKRSECSVDSRRIVVTNMVLLTCTAVVGTITRSRAFDPKRRCFNRQVNVFKLLGSGENEYLGSANTNEYIVPAPDSRCSNGALN
jgi:hypothetical protein